MNSVEGLASKACFIEAVLKADTTDPVQLGELLEHFNEAFIYSPMSGPYEGIPELATYGLRWTTRMLTNDDEECPDLAADMVTITPKV